MNEINRGVYEPAERVRVFDGSEDDEDIEGSRLPVLIVIALVVLIAFAGVVWLAYEKGVASGRNEPRIASIDGEPTTQYKGLKIYEQPAPSDADVVTAAPAPKANDVSAQPVTAAPPPVAKTNEENEQAAAPSVPLKPPGAAPAAPSQTAVVKPPIVAAVPKKAPALPPPSVAARAEEAVDTAPAVTSAYLLQIGSYKSETEAADAWSAAKAAHASLLEGLSPDVKKVDLGEKGTWFRLRIAPFADKAAAVGLCEKLKAEGGNCLLAR